MQLIDAPNLVVIVYPCGAAGKTVIIPLMFSSDSIMMSLEIDMQASAEEKYEFIKNKLKLNTKNSIWTDLVKPMDFFGKSYHKILENNKDNNNFNFFKKIENKDIILSAINSKKTFFATVHSYADVTTLRTSFKNFKIILMTNCQKFLKNRNISFLNEGVRTQIGENNNLTKCYTNVSGSNWPKMLPYTFDEIKKSEPAIRAELLEFLKQLNYMSNYFYSFEVDNQMREFLGMKDIDYIYDSTHLLDSKSFINSIMDLYNFFDFRDFNQDYISEFYKIWANFNLK